MSSNYGKALIGKKRFEKKESWPKLIETSATSPDVAESLPGPSEPEKPQEVKKVQKNDLPIKSDKRKFKKPTSQISIDLFQAVQNALQSKKTVKTAGIKRRKKIVEKVGNRLDSDRPTLHKGKVRLKKKRLTVAKRCFLLVRNLPKSKAPFSPSILNLKNEISRLKTVDVATLSQTFEKVKIDETETLSSVSKITSEVIHTNKFKGYCRNRVSDDLKKSVRELITMLRKFQDKLHARDEIKAHAKRRYVCGMKESKKFVLCNKAKCLIVATDLEIDGGLPSYEILETLVNAADLKDIPVIYCALSKELGYWTLKKRKISVLAILDYDGANEVFKQMILHWEKGKTDYENLTKTTNDFFLSKKDVSILKDEDIESEIRDQMILKLTDKQDD